METQENKKTLSPIQRVIHARYGNNIKKLVEYTKTIKDRNKRNMAARQIIEAMKIINKDIQNMEDYERVLWNHLAILADYELDIDYPYPIIPLEDFDRKPEKIDYPDQNIRFRHYGKIIEQMIQKAIEEQDPQLKEEMVRRILIQMKKSYLFHAHAGNYVKDDVILRDFERLSKGQLKVPQNFSFPHSRDILERFSGVPEAEYEKRIMGKSNNQRKNK